MARKSAEQEWVTTNFIPDDSPLPSGKPVATLEGLPNTQREAALIQAQGCDVNEWDGTIPGDLLDIFTNSKTPTKTT
jgi:hypothetical protein